MTSVLASTFSASASVRPSSEWTTFSRAAGVRLSLIFEFPFTSAAMRSRSSWKSCARGRSKSTTVTSFSSSGGISSIGETSRMVL